MCNCVIQESNTCYSRMYSFIQLIERVRASEEDKYQKEALMGYRILLSEVRYESVFHLWNPLTSCVTGGESP